MTYYPPCPTIVVYADNGPGRMWACAKCGIRFYPACRTCVDVGHRNETHPEQDTPPAAPLDEDADSWGPDNTAGGHVHWDDT